ncbi:succinylglutamate desuccinylase/aspartoacylase family protein, partial [Candidatus Pacearchaeota archaeon]|nr:succinylglutamate desuccinylase/aspartoacylase family protein [Candidatus Pacearchaeota archaeon]
MMEKLVIICCLHGNEIYGLEVCKDQSLFPFILANEKALKENKRFIDSDLNRSFPGKADGNYEERRAFELTKKLK